MYSSQDDPLWTAISVMNGAERFGALLKRLIAGLLANLPSSLKIPEYSNQDREGFRGLASWLSSLESPPRDVALAQIFYHELGRPESKVQSCFISSAPGIWWRCEAKARHHEPVDCFELSVGEEMRACSRVSP